MEPISMSEQTIRGYGRMVHPKGGTPAYDSPEFSFDGDVFRFQDYGSVTVGVLVGKKRDQKIDKMERHLSTSELLVQVSNDCVLYLAKPSESVPSRKEIQPFRLNQGQAVVLDEGTWHWVPFPVDDECTTLVIFKDKTPDEDYEERPVPGN